MTGLRHDHALCGWRVASALPLPELPRWDGDDRSPDISVELNPSPGPFADAGADLSPFLIEPDGTSRFYVAGVAAYWIDPAGRRIVVAPETAAETDVRLFLLGTVFGILCYARGMAPLHAGAVRIGAGAVAVVGPSGVGKSTLAAALMQVGHPVMADDVTVVDAFAPEGPLVLPAYPRLKLCADAVKYFGFAPVDGGHSQIEPKKYHIPVHRHFCAAPSPLRAIFVLERGDGDNAPPRRLKGSAAAARLIGELYRPGLPARLGRSAQMLRAMAVLAGVPGGAWIIRHRHETGGLERSVADILALVSGG